LISADDIATAKYDIEIWRLAEQELYLYQDGLLIAALSKENFDITVEFGKLILIFWSAERARSWRVTAYRIVGKTLIMLAATPFNKETHRLELRARDAEIERQDRKSARRDYLARLCNLIEQSLGGLKIIRRSIGRSDPHGYQAAYARLLLRDGHGLIAAVGISAREDYHASAALLGQGINWLMKLRAGYSKDVVHKLMLFAPQGRADLLAERLTLISQSEQQIELFEVDESAGELRFVRPFDQGDLGLRWLNGTHLPNAARWPALGAPLAGQLAWIRSLAPEMIEMRPNALASCVKVEINGLELARAYCGNRARIEFGVEEKKILSRNNEIELVALVEAVANYRCSGSLMKQHPYYRMAGEAWLEAILRRDIRALDPELSPGYLYSQVPAIKQSNEKFIDLLAVRSDGQLTIIELKVGEEVELPFQGLDYWLRVEWHRARADFLRQGYFPGIALKDAPARIYLVAPRLRFHKNFVMLARLIDSRAAVFRIAINDNWREGLKVYDRERMN
jgi:hypothetical protein